MSDSLGDGTGHPTDAQIRLYRHWASGGVAASIICEVQASPHFAEEPGNLVLNAACDISRFEALADAGAQNDTRLWLQLGHGGALAHAPTSTPAGPSALDLPGLRCGAPPLSDIRLLPAEFARVADMAQGAGFGGVQIHRTHGFILNQFLSPRFNQRTDLYGGNIHNRKRLLLEVIEAVRAAVRPGFAIALKLNASDQLERGLDEADSLAVLAALDRYEVDLIDISGGTYFPGAKSASDSGGQGPYFRDSALRARLHIAAADVDRWDQNAGTGAGGSSQWRCRCRRVGPGALSRTVLAQPVERRPGDRTSRVSTNRP